MTTSSLNVLNISTNPVKIGTNAGFTNQSLSTIAIGVFTGYTGQLTGAIALGNNAGSTIQGVNSVAIGSNAGSISQGSGSIGIGFQAQFFGPTGSTGINAIAIGSEAASYTQGSGAIAIGYQAGNGQTGAQGINAIAVGTSAGKFLQGRSAIAIGDGAGNERQSTLAIAIGTAAGQYNQANDAIAIGSSAGGGTNFLDTFGAGQASGAIAIGNAAGLLSQGANSIAIGGFAGYASMGTNSISLGYLATSTNGTVQANTIIINASGTTLGQATQSNACYIAPIRSVPNGSLTGFSTVMYSVSSREIIYSTVAKSFVIDHPLDKSRYLVHTCLEGPEAGIYYRGEGHIALSTTKTVVDLPNYVKNMGYDFTVHVTSIAPENIDEEEVIRPYRVSRVKDNRFTVHGSPGDFYWHAYGKRFDVEVEPLRENVNVKGTGPYTWVSLK
jgi:hypothetical protein